MSAIPTGIVLARPGRRPAFSVRHGLGPRPQAGPGRVLRLVTAGSITFIPYIATRMIPPVGCPGSPVRERKWEADFWLK